MEKANNTLTDLTYLNELAKGDSNFILEMINVFMEQTPEAIANLEKHYKEKNWKMLRAVAHKMKPSFSFVGLKGLSEVINSLEDYAEKEIHLDAMPEMISEIKNSCTQAISELEKQRNGLL